MFTCITGYITTEPDLAVMQARRRQGRPLLGKAGVQLLLLRYNYLQMLFQSA